MRVWIIVAFLIIGLYIGAEAQRGEGNGGRGGRAGNGGGRGGRAGNGGRGGKQWRGPRKGMIFYNIIIKAE